MYRSRSGENTIYRKPEKKLACNETACCLINRKQEKNLACSVLNWMLVTRNERDQQECMVHASGPRSAARGANEPLTEAVFKT